MDIKPLNRAGLLHENGLKAQRLLPWPALNAPFEGSWCVILPGTASVLHAHHEYEIFIAVSGSATLDSQGQRRSFVAGDIVFFPPDSNHSVINDSAENFEMYSIWWDAEMSRRFLHRHTKEV